MRYKQEERRETRERDKQIIITIYSRRRLIPLIHLRKHNKQTNKQYTPRTSKIKCGNEHRFRYNP